MSDRRNNDDILETIRAEIKATVNGKIDKVDKKVDDIHLRLDKQEEILAKQDEVLAKLNTELTPYRDGLTFWKVSYSILKGLAAVITALGIIYGAFRLAIPKGTYVFQKTSDADISQVVIDGVNQALANKEFKVTK